MMKIDRMTNVALWLLLINLWSARLTAQPVLTPDPKFWTPNGPVNSILAVGDTLYLGGDFTYVGPRTGPAATFAAIDGQPLGAPPMINGTVRAVVPDGNGGWYVGGAFTSVGETRITNVVHLNADLTVDSGWNPKIIGAGVNALLVSSNRVYIAGQFTRVGGQAIAILVGVNASTGEVEWNPAGSGSQVNAMRLDNGLLYVGGNFTRIGGSNRQNLAAIHVESLQPTAWNPGADGAVLALVIEGNTVYVGGQFNNAGTKPRSRLAALDIDTGVATTWNPNPNGVVRALEGANGSVYVGGDFTTVSVTSRRGFAVLNGTSGAAEPLDLQLLGGPAQNLVRSIYLDGDSLYVGGQFTGALGEPHVMSVGVDLLTGEALPGPLATEFNGPANANYGINAIAQAGGRIFVGGDFTSVGGVARQRAAALSIETGAALPWSPAFDASVLTMASGPAGLFVGGAFTNVNATTKARGLALVDPLNGNALAFPFAATNGAAAVVVRSLALQNETLFVGGAFTVVTNFPRRFVVALNAATGAPLAPFDAKLTGGSIGVNSLAIAGGNLYLGGDFTALNGVAMPRLAAVSPQTGAAVTWNPKPSPNQAVNEIVAEGDRLYVAGQFTSISGVTLRSLAIYHIADHSLLPIDATLPNGAILSALIPTPHAVYLSGNFTSVGGETRRNLAALDAATAGAYEWNPAPDVAPSVLVLNDHYLFAGGTFRSMNGQLNGFLSAFPRSPKLALVRDNATLRITGNNGDRVEAVWQSAPSLQNPVWTDIATNRAGFLATLELPIGSGHEFFRAISR